MDNLTGIKQIAKLANVSIGTVDRVLHDRPGVSKATREKIKAIIKETGYKKNTVASRLNLAGRKKLKI
ncbi:MAG TPA: transcriptional regulator, partial [Arenibacter sp.]|nr:transcriptional regulator [Arenibacter sp.]